MELLVEWELTMKCNYDCGYCGLLDNNIKAETDEKKLTVFMDTLHEKYPSTELFLFGGEPFLHPKIGFIIEYLQSLNQPFVIQTNFSKFSVHRMLEIGESNNKPFNINISIHPDDVSLSDMALAFRVPLNVNINNLDVMYVGKKSLEYYKVIEGYNKGLDPVLTPLVNIGCKGYEKALKEYNRLKHKKVYQELYNFDDVMANVIGIEEERSVIWEKFNKREYTTLNKPCLYQNRYFLYDANLDLFNCCYRKNNNGYCLNEVCFLM